MKFSLFKNKTKSLNKNLPDNRQEALIKTGREQFKKLIERGTELPVVLL